MNLKKKLSVKIICQKKSRQNITVRIVFILVKKHTKNHDYNKNLEINLITVIIL